MSRESNLTRLWLKWVESESSRPWKSRLLVESESNHADCHLSQSWVNWILLESKLSHWFFEEKTSRSCNYTYVTLQRKNRPTATFDRTPPPPRSTTFPKLGKMWWVVRLSWLNSDPNELSKSWVRLVNLGFELSRSWVRLANLGFELSRSWVTWIVIWVRVESVNPGTQNETWTKRRANVNGRLLCFHHTELDKLHMTCIPWTSLECLLCPDCVCYCLWPVWLRNLRFVDVYVTFAPSEYCAFVPMILRMDGFARSWPSQSGALWSMRNAQVPTSTVRSGTPGLPNWENLVTNTNIQRAGRDSSRSLTSSGHECGHCHQPQVIPVRSK